MKSVALYLTLVLCIIIIFGSCKFKQSTNSCNNSSDTLLAKTISFPNSLLRLEGSQFYETDSFVYEIKDKLKIISIVDGNCMKCIVGQLNYIDSIFNSILYDNDNILIFVLNVNERDSIFFMRNLQPEIKTSGIILWDNNYSFERKNKLFTRDINLRTFMLNQENEIVSYGNPVINPNVIFEYQEKLEENLNAGIND